MAGSFPQRSAAALGVIALVSALAGCSDDSDADPDRGEGSSPSVSTTPSEPSSSPTPDPGPSVPPAPGDLGEVSKAGAEVLVRYYFEVVDYAQKTGDVKKLKTLSRPGCDACLDTYIGLRGIYKDGGFIRGAKHSLSNLRVARFGKQEAFRIDLTLHSTKQRARASKGAKLQTVPKSVDEMMFVLSSNDNGTLMVDYWEVKVQQ